MNAEEIVKQYKDKAKNMNSLYLAPSSDSGKRNQRINDSIIEKENHNHNAENARKAAKSRIICIPKIGCTIPFLMDLLNSGEIVMETIEIEKAVNIILKAKLDLDAGIP